MRVTSHHEHKFDETVVTLGFRGFFLQRRIDGNDGFSNETHYRFANKGVMSANETMDREHGKEFLIELFETDGSGTTARTARNGSCRRGSRSRGVGSFLRSSCCLCGCFRLGLGFHCGLL